MIISGRNIESIVKTHYQKQYDTNTFFFMAIRALLCERGKYADLSGLIKTLSEACETESKKPRRYSDFRVIENIINLHLSKYNLKKI